MLLLLTKYLFQSRQVCIPGIGSFAVEARPAQLDTANKQILPPGYAVRYSEEETLSDDQLNELAHLMKVNENTAKERVAVLGRELRRQIRGSRFEWKGIGFLEEVNGKVAFSPEASLTTLEPVPAERVIREGVTHTVLVGDQEVQSNGEPPLEAAPPKKRSVEMIIAWVLLALAVLFIIYYLYTQGILSPSGGLQSRPRIEEGGNGYN